jgi:hypothetical protein
MNTRTFTREKVGVAMIALVAGFVGSIMHHWIHSNTVMVAASSAPGVLRAKRRTNSTRLQADKEI